MGITFIKKTIRRVIFACFIFFLLLILYTIWDNNRITITNQSIFFENLPQGLEDFKILQVTDLHERVFGEKQKELIEAINSVHYDAIVFTGDMLDHPESKNYVPFYTLIEGVENKENAFFVPGNTDPNSYVLELSSSRDKDDFVKGMEERDVKLLKTIEEIKVNSSKLYFTYLENSILKLEDLWNDEEASKLNTVLNNLKNSDILIALNHYPVPDMEIEFYKQSDEYTFKNFDLIIAGHYHGGQIRLPIIGALFIPESWYSGGGFFPPQDRVKGLWEYKGIQQYVSTGLGSSDAISFLEFRFLNPPEINVLTLKRK